MEKCEIRDFKFEDGRGSGFGEAAVVCLRADEARCSGQAAVRGWGCFMLGGGSGLGGVLGAVAILRLELQIPK